MTLIASLIEKLPIPSLQDENTPRVGGLIQALTRKEEKKGETSSVTPYSALLQARSAALALDKEFKGTATAVAPNISTAAVFLPIVVLEGTLLLYSLGANLKESLIEVDSLVASVPGDAESEAALVPVVTEKFAETMSDLFYPSAHNFCVAMLPHAHEVADALRLGRVLEAPTV